MAYFIFPGFYRFWKKYLLHAEASEHRLFALKALENLQILYKETEQVIKGRGVILFALSLAAWAVEMGCAVWISQGYPSRGRYAVLMEYLLPAMSGGESEGLSRFIFVSVLLLAAGYLLLTFLCRADREAGRL